MVDQAVATEGLVDGEIAEYLRASSSVLFRYSAYASVDVLRDGSSGWFNMAALATKIGWWERGHGGIRSPI